MLLRHFYFNETLAQAVHAPRVHHQLMPMQLHYEPELNEEVREALLARGHRMTTSVYPGGFGSINAIESDRYGRVQALNDPRREGSLEVFKAI